MSTNLAPLYGSIVESTSPLTTSDYPVGRIIDGSSGTDGKITSWQYYQDGNLLDYPIYAIIDLGIERPIEEFQLIGISYEWGGGGCPSSYNIAVANNTSDGTVPNEGDFDIVWSSGMPSPNRVYSTQIWTNTSNAIIQPRYARYVRIQVFNTFDLESVWMGIGEFAIYEAISVIADTITSDAEITTPNEDGYTSITSDATVEIPVLTSSRQRTNITSDTLIYGLGGTDNPASEIPYAIVRYSESINSSAEVYWIGQRMLSVAVIYNTVDAITITSDASISNTGYSLRSASIAHPGHGDLYILPDYYPGDFNRREVVYSILLSTSLETTVADMFTSPSIDITDSNPPFGYQNYDWSYDWVARAYNKAIYIVEARYAETLTELDAAVFNEVDLGYRFERGAIPRYHQFRLHVWASGSGDFEFHQFSVRSHVVYDQNKYYKMLIDQDFLATDVINLTTPRTWTPDLSQARIWSANYLPGDFNNDGLVNEDDILAWANYLTNGTSGSVEYYGANPRNLDTNGDGLVNIADLVYLVNYISGSGPPPRVHLLPDTYLPGDFNNDGIVDGNDVVAMANYIVTQTKDSVAYYGADPRNQDVNGDGVLNIADIVYLVRYISGSGPAPRYRD